MRSHAKAMTAASTHREANRFSLGVIAAVLLGLVFLGLGASAASAAPSASMGWEVRASFASNPGPVHEPVQNSVAVDSNGNILVANRGQSRFDIYAPDPVTGGNLLTEAGVALAGVRNIAIDPSDDTVYVDGFTLFGDTSIRRYTSDGAPVPTYTRDESFEVPAAKGTAVDPTTGDLLVADPGAEGVQRYDTSGTLVETIATPGIAPWFIASAPDGSFYIASETGPDVVHLSGSGTVLGTIVDVGALEGLTWDSSDQLLVAATGGLLKNYSATGGLEGESPAETSTGLGLAFDPVENVLYQSSNDPVYAYEPATIPGVEDPVVSEVMGHSAHLSTEVAPGEGPPAESKVHFEYSEDGGVSWVSTPDQELTTEDVAEISADITGLLANQEYLVRVKASNAGATKTSSTVSFTTAQIAPEVEVTDASGVQETNAVLNGSINPNGLQTTYYFEYGATTSYGARVPVLVDGVAGSERVSREFSQSISGLAPRTTYHFRLVAENGIGQAVSADASFATAGTGEISPKRGYEQVTPVDKGGAQVLSDFHVQIAEQGSAIAVSAVSGALNSESAMMRQNFVVRRSASGWENWEATDPPIAGTPGVFESATQAVSEDYKHAMVASNVVLAPGAVAGAGNLYIKDLRTGGYEFVGSAPGGFGELTGGNIQEQVFAAGAPDFSWVLFWSEKPMVDGVTGRALYRWSKEGGLSVESQAPSGGLPSSSIASIPNANFKLPPASADGTLTAFDPGAYFVFFPTFEFGGGVYIRRAGGPSTPIAISRLPGAEPVNDSSSVLDWVTPDGRYVFFQSPNRLTEDVPATVTEHAVYRYDTETDDLIFIGFKAEPASFGFLGASDDGQTAYLSTAPGSVDPKTTVWHDGATHVVVNEQVTNATVPKYVTPDGRYFAWNGPGGKVYLYDAEADEKVCVSCSPGGGAGQPAHFSGVGRDMGNQKPRAITEDGTMFFDTKTALLPSDHNSSKDVYAYKDGHLTLITPGNADLDAFFVGASADGTDVYFQTDQGLVPKDTDNASDVYDARVGGGFAEAPATPKCSGEGCRGTAGGVPPGPSLGSSANDGDGTGAAISGVKALTAAQRKTLARGGKVQLKVMVTKAGTVAVTGRAGGQKVIASRVKSKQTGSVSVPLKLSKAGLSKLAKGDPLQVKLAIAFDGKTEKTMNMALKRAAGKRKGGRS